jgi:hypothetical protein
MFFYFGERATLKCIYQTFEDKEWEHWSQERGTEKQNPADSVGLSRKQTAAIFCNI